MSPPAKKAFPFINNVCSHQNMFVYCADRCALVGRRGRARRHRSYQPPSNSSTTQSSLILCIGELFSGNFMTRTIREMVGAVPVCPPERPRSDVSIRKGHISTRKGSVSIRKEHVPIRKSDVSIHKRCMLTPKHVYAFADGCALMGRRGRAHRHLPYQPPSNPSATQSSSF